MAEQALIQVRVDSRLKEEVSEIYEDLGLDLPTAVRMFLSRSRMVRGIPFETRLPERESTTEDARKSFENMCRISSEMPEMTLDEINEEIKAVRAEKRGITL